MLPVLTTDTKFGGSYLPNIKGGDEIGGDDGNSSSISVDFPLGTLAKWQTAKDVKTDVSIFYTDTSDEVVSTTLICNFK